MQFLKSFLGHIRSIIHETVTDKFRFSLLLACAAIFVLTAYILPGMQHSSPVYTAASGDKVATLYHSYTCPYCKKAVKFINSTLKSEYPEVKFKEFELSSPEFTQEEQEKLGQIAQKYKFEAIPVFYIDGNDPIIGFDEEKTPDEYRSLIEKNFYTVKSDNTELESNDANKRVKTETQDDSKRYVDVPFMGRIDVFQYSVPFLAVVLGVLDGFNPCAMWVLVFMISIIIEMRDKRKMWLIVGSFLLASAILYYAVMAGWINLFLLFGYMRNLTILIGAVALYTAGLSLKSFYEGHMVCEADNFEERSRISKKIQHLAESPVSLATLAGVIGLAFVVNSIEFLCSAALPAIFTNVLAITVHSTFLHYWYILIYVFFFMIDDIIIFSLAALAVEKFVGDKYVKWCKLIGGVILLGLGVAMVFFPDILTGE